MFGVLTNKGKVPYISLDEFISIDKMKYFDKYLEKQLYDKFLNQPNPPETNQHPSKTMFVVLIGFWRFSMLLPL